MVVPSAALAKILRILERLDIAAYIGSGSALQTGQCPPAQSMTHRPKTCNTTDAARAHGTLRASPILALLDADIYFWCSRALLRIMLPSTPSRLQAVILYEIVQHVDQLKSPSGVSEFVHWFPSNEPYFEPQL